jgi:hypothetical protein
MAGSFFCFTTIKRSFSQSYSANWIWYTDVAEARLLCPGKSLHASSFAIKAQVAGRMTETPRRRSKVNSTTKMFAGGEISIGAWAGWDLAAEGRQDSDLQKIVFKQECFVFVHVLGRSIAIVSFDMVTSQKVLTMEIAV